MYKAVSLMQCFYKKKCVTSKLQIDKYFILVKFQRIETPKHCPIKVFILESLFALLSIDHISHGNFFR